jgi:uncharacterized protein YciI
LSIDELTERLDDRFSLLGGGRSRRRQRQQTLQAMMDWSYGLLDDDEQQVLNQLAVFAGTFSLSGVEAVVASNATTVLDVMDSLVEQSLVVASVESGRYRLLETVRLYALDRLLNTDQLAATRDRHLAWIDALSGSERLASAGAGETWELEEQKLAEVANAVAAMEWAEQTNQNDALLSLYIGSQFIWQSTGSLAVSWLDRIPEPPTSEPYLRSQWLTTSGQIRVFAGDAAKAYEQFSAAAAIVDELIETGQPANLAFASLLLRGLLPIPSDASAALVESDRLSDLQVEGDARYAEWMSLFLRTNVLMFQGDAAALDSARELEAVGRTVSRAVDDNSVAMTAILLSRTERFEEALATSMHCLDSPVMGQGVRMNLLVPAAKSLAALGRYEAALDVVEKDFGPMIDAQRRRLMGSQLVSLILILHQLQRLERINELAGLASAYGQEMMGADTEVPRYLADIVGNDEAFAALPRPDPADMMTNRVATLIEDIVTELRNHIAQEPDPSDAASSAV